jgi:hypothetical protein
MSGAEQALATLRDFVERSTHWKEGDADRHAAINEALPVIVDNIEWLEKGIEEWRSMYLASERQIKTSGAVARTAVRHLNSVLNGARTHSDQQFADTAARDWLESLGNDTA